MVHREELKGCKVVIREPESLEVLLETNVLDYSRDRAVITIEDEEQRLKRLDKVSVIILGRGKAYEYSGSTRRLPGNTRLDIALYSCKVTPIRAEQRFSVNDEAWVEHFIEKKSGTLMKLPFKIYIINISASGALIEPLHQRFEVGEIFVMRMKMGGTEVKVTTEVCREERGERQIVRYGCKFLRVK